MKNTRKNITLSTSGGRGRQDTCKDEVSCLGSFGEAEVWKPTNYHKDGSRQARIDLDNDRWQNIECRCIW